MGGGGSSSKTNATPAGSFSWQGGGGGSNFSPEKFNSTMGSDILAAYKKGPSDTFDQSLYTGLSGTTQQGLSGLLDAANQNAGMFDAGIDYTTGLLGGGGFAGGQQGNVGTINQVAGQYGDIAGNLTGPSAAESDFRGIAGNLTGASAAEGDFRDIAGNLTGPSAAQTGFTSLYQQAGGPSLTEETLLSRARGDDITNNPFLDDIISQTNDNTYADVMASLGGSGRTGSSLHVDALGSALADNESRLRYADYDQALDRQTQALGLIEQMRQQGFGNQFSALGASDAARRGQLSDRMGAISAADAARRAQLGDRMGAISAADAARLGQLNTRMGALGAQAGAAGNAFNMEQTGVANAMGATAALPGLFDTSLQPSRTVLGVGQAMDADKQAQRLAEFEKFQRVNDPVFQHLAKYQGLLGQQAGNPQPEKGPGLFDWLGLGIAGAGALL